MNRFSSIAKTFAIAAATLGALGAASIAQARTDVAVVIGQPARIAVGEPYGHRHVPAPVPMYDHRDHYRGGGAYGDSDRDGIPNRFDRDSRFYDWRAARQDAQWGDWDRDGVVNRFDRAPNNPRRH